ncbi:MAG: LysM peptidoglycan-binding domain-containing protein [Phycisphaeraceae bacterium]|nr:LysM peptidoglycan-binding domain-containing protein [Phycisphaeraceae bacterium]
MLKASSMLALGLVIALSLGACQSNRQTTTTEPDAWAHDPFDPGTPDAIADTRPANGFEPFEPAPPPPARGGTHTVQRGDTLWSIAVRHYGDGQRWRDIASANNITNPQSLRVGQVLQLP